MPLGWVVINQITAIIVYMAVGDYFEFNEAMFSIPAFMLNEVVCELFDLTLNVENYKMWISVFGILHLIIYAVAAMMFYLEERKKQHYRLKREAEHRMEMQTEA